ncbi:alpha/beta fold hydrolase [Propionibacteriaceae bacterium Y1700]|uniref:alpha/beta fold hydrolase n=1 Tax=Microlunatus sp. Y1700 TaxID=3418487 RepID=UPI003DA79BCB
MSTARPPSRVARRPRQARVRRRILAGVGIVALVGVVLALQPSPPVGHWRSAAGQDDFGRDYDRAMAELPTPTETHDLRTDFGIVRMYRFAGTAEQPTTSPFLLLPGRGASTPMWAGFLERLLPLGDVYAVDLLGEPGRSIQERPVTNAADQAAWLDQALAQLPPDQFHVLGLSIGGWTAANLAVHRPEPVASLTLLDPVFTVADLRPEVIVRSLPAVLPWMPKAWRDDFNAWTAGGESSEGELVAAMLESGQKNYRTSLPAPTRITEDQLGRLDMPVLLVLGGASVMHDAAKAEQVARRAMPHAVVKVHPGGSHAVGLQEPDLVVTELTRLIRR